MYHFIKTPHTLIVHFEDGSSFVWASDHANYDKACTKVLREQAPDEEVRDLMDIKRVIQRSAGDHVTVDDYGVHYRGKTLNTTLTNRILKMIAEGYDASPMVAFLERCLKSPRRTVIQELYDFLEVAQLPLTRDGKFIAYKIVKDDYMDIFSGTFDNSVGKTCEMDANEVVEDRTQTCAAGLHVCSKGYLPYYGAWGTGRHVMIVEVDPADVVAIPRDYHNSKMRVSKYVVVGEMTTPEAVEILERNAVMKAAETGGYSYDDGFVDSYAGGMHVNSDDCDETEVDDDDDDADNFGSPFDDDPEDDISEKDPAWW